MTAVQGRTTTPNAVNVVADGLNPIPQYRRAVCWLPAALDGNPRFGRLFESAGPTWDARSTQTSSSVRLDKANRKNATRDHD
jgi:hypothetical protein